MSSRFKKHSFSRKEWERKAGEGIPLSNLMEDHRTEWRRGQIQTWRHFWSLSTCLLLLSGSLLSLQQLVSNLSEHKGEQLWVATRPAVLWEAGQTVGSLPPSGRRGQEVNESHCLQCQEMKWSPSGKTEFHPCLWVYCCICPLHLELLMSFLPFLFFYPHHPLTR